MHLRGGILNAFSQLVFYFNMDAEDAIFCGRQKRKMKSQREIRRVNEPIELWIRSQTIKRTLQICCVL